MIAYAPAADAMPAGYSHSHPHPHPGPHLNGQMRPDAGMRHLNHYAANLPTWRYHLRQSFIPIVRWETPYLAAVQHSLRTPWLDTYFACTANLGTHTFFMIALPMLFWFGYTSLGRALAHLLAFGVILSGIVKDLLCLPRPLSPPLQRITMSGSAALEYGFPSTHSTNAISVVVYIVYLLRISTDLSDSVRFYGVLAAYFYGSSIVFGRLYCGMHGFFDCIVGSVLGAAIAFAQIAFGEAFDQWLWSSSYIAPLTTTLVMLIIVRMHPEPADDCPCFDDSVSFAGVIIGIQIAGWSFPKTSYAWQDPVPGTTPYSFEQLGIVLSALRVVMGVVIIFAWRGLMKPLLFKTLPPLFRRIETFGVDLPRTFFLKASQYTIIPPLRKDDNVIPSASDIPSMMNDIRQRRGRVVSVGPQSAADAYEQIEYRRELHRRRSMSLERELTDRDALSDISESPDSSPTSFSAPPTSYIPALKESDLPLRGKASGYFSTTLSKSTVNGGARSPRPRPPPSPSRKASWNAAMTSRPPYIPLPTPFGSRLSSFSKLTSATVSPHPLLTPPTSDLELDDPLALGAVSPLARQPSHTEEFPFYDLAEQRFREEEIEIFGRIQKVRVRYDVEVVTKLVVYAGIAWLACMGCPLGFEIVGLGLGVR